jgi:hypothetical protein
MTSAQMDEHMALAATQCKPFPYITVDRSRHPSVTETSLWLFDDTHTHNQIGSVSLRKLLAENDWVWKANRMHRSSPVSERLFDTLSEAVQHIIDYATTQHSGVRS